MLLVRTKALSNFTAQALNSLTSESIDVSGGEGDVATAFWGSSSERRKSCSSVAVSYNQHMKESNTRANYVHVMLTNY